MHTGLTYTCPKSLLTQIPPLLRARGITLENPTTHFTCQKNAERLHIQIVDSPEFLSVIQLLLEVPIVVDRSDLLAEVITVLRNLGALEGPADEIRCPCGYRLANNTSGQCPECGRAVEPRHFA